MFLFQYLKIIFIFALLISTGCSKMNKDANHLINETSPYLLLHAHNPVDWYPWGEEALEKAKKENNSLLFAPREFAQARGNHLISV